MKLRHGSLFSGIGGFDLAADWAGWENVFHCEWNPFGQRVLKYYWPNAESFNDITKSDFSKYEHSIDIISGGFPCQPFSTAGQRRGTEDSRHLWPAMLDVIRTVKPRYVVGENVYGLVNWNEGMVFDEVCTDLEAEGYEVQAFLLPAAAVNAPHRRDRIWFVAHTMRPRHAGTAVAGTKGFAGRASSFSDGERTGPHSQTHWRDWPKQPYVLLRNDGIPAGLDAKAIPKIRRETIKAMGNAIVPQVALQIFNAINEYEDATRGRS
jgi:DNA (cytosine-5)-methyltransferase 1